MCEYYYFFQQADLRDETWNVEQLFSPLTNSSFHGLFNNQTGMTFPWDGKNWKLVNVTSSVIKKPKLSKTGKPNPDSGASCRYGNDSG